MKAIPGTLIKKKVKITAFIESLLMNNSKIGMIIWHLPKEETDFAFWAKKADIIISYEFNEGLI